MLRFLTLATKRPPSQTSIVWVADNRAAMVCVETAERWNKRGDEEAAQLWIRIMEAVRKLDAEKLKGPAH
jgi:hypothetical protein